MLDQENRLRQRQAAREAAELSGATGVAAEVVMNERSGEEDVDTEDAGSQGEGKTGEGEEQRGKEVGEKDGNGVTITKGIGTKDRSMPTNADKEQEQDETHSDANSGNKQAAARPTTPTLSLPKSPSTARETPAATENS